MITDCTLPTYVCREARSKLLELPKVWANVDFPILRASILVQKHAQQCLRSTCILNCLSGKPHVLFTLSVYGREIKLSVLRLVFLLLLASGVFEKEDDTNGVKLLKRFGIQ
jgi:hypothetical protein